MADRVSLQDDKLFISKIDDMVKLAAKRGAVFSSFLNARECQMAENELNRLMYRNYRLYGIFDNAERKILCVYKEYFQPDDADFPIDCVTFNFRSQYNLTHRDFLGSLMALGIKRETVGDIVIHDGIAQIAVSDTVKALITADMKKIGSAGVKYNENFSGTLLKNQNFKEISGTTASLRLDAVASLALNLSRSKVADIIKSVGAEVNFVMKYDCSFVLNEGDIFSVRGYGKFKISELSGITKKNRMHVKVLKYC